MVLNAVALFSLSGRHHDVVLDSTLGFWAGMRCFRCGLLCLDFYCSQPAELDA